MWNIKEIFEMIKRELGVSNSSSNATDTTTTTTPTMKRILRIKGIADKLMDELNNHGGGVNLDVDDHKMAKLVHELQCKISDKESALKKNMKKIQTISYNKKGPDHSISHNHKFCEELHSANPYSSCVVFVVSPESGYLHGISEKLKCGQYIVIKNPKESWPYIEQDITNQVLAHSSFTVRAEVAISIGPQTIADVGAYLWMECQDSTVFFFSIGWIYATTDHWKTLEGTFSLTNTPRKATLCLSGPPLGVDLLIKSLVVSRRCSIEYNVQTAGFKHDDIIHNPKIENGHNNWSRKGKLVLHDSMGNKRVLPKSGKFIVPTKNRYDKCNGIAHEITGRVQRKLAYNVVVAVRIFGNNMTSADVRATVWVLTSDLREQYMGIGSVKATDKDWVQLQGKFLVNCYASRVIIYLEGTPPGTDILFDNLVVKHAAGARPASPPIIQKAIFGVNIIANSDLSDGTNGWFPLWNCTLTSKTGSPRILPHMAADSLGRLESLSGRYIHVTNRIHDWDGPAQIITTKVKPYVTYQVAAWVRIDANVTKPQIINVGIKVDNQWVSAVKSEINDEQWNEIGGSFRVENQPTRVKVCVQGPAVGVDFMVSGFQMFPVDRQARFRHLRKQTERIRKRDVSLKFTSSNASTLHRTSVRIRQTQNSFPFGSRVNMPSIDNEDFVDFFSKNFSWITFPEELDAFRTWQDNGNYGNLKSNHRNAKEILDFLEFSTRHNFQIRGHCVIQFQSWMEELSLLSRYKKTVKHYDVDNKMTLGSFGHKQDHFGKKFMVKKFKKTKQVDPSATLFAKDYHVEDGRHPDKYADYILDLQKKGAPIEGIGIKGHVNSPIGPIVCAALNKLAKLELPIWFTELSVSSDNEYVRADDLEVMIREAFAHNAVKGIMLCGFWELLMVRSNAHLVNAEGDINEAGKRYLAMKQEWLSDAHGHLDEQGGFDFRGFYGTYNVEVVSSSGKKVEKTFVVDEGEDPITITINL